MKRTRSTIRGAIVPLDDRAENCLRSSPEQGSGVGRCKILLLDYLDLEDLGFWIEVHARAGVEVLVPGVAIVETEFLSDLEDAISAVAAGTAFNQEMRHTLKALLSVTRRAGEAGRPVVFQF